jgi:uncharacterized membrane protein YphA (DoxX/SURF4 family)
VAGGSVVIREYLGTLDLVGTIAAAIHLGVGADQVDSMEAFYKDLSIMGGFLLLYLPGAGRYSIDVLCGIAAP